MQREGTEAVTRNAFDYAEAVWRDLATLKATLSVWRWTDCHGRPRDHVTLVAGVDGELIGGVQVPIAK